jgi:hypothetical protein
MRKPGNVRARERGRLQLGPFVPGYPPLAPAGLALYFMQAVERHAEMK